MFIERVLADLNVTCGLLGMALRYFIGRRVARQKT